MKGLHLHPVFFGHVAERRDIVHEAAHTDRTPSIRATRMSNLLRSRRMAFEGARLEDLVGIRMAMTKTSSSAEVDGWPRR